MLNFRRMAAWAATSFTLAGPAAASDVQVRVLNVADDAGSVRVALCVVEQWLKPNCMLGARAPAHRGVVTVTVRDVQPGTYGVLAHHDRNDDGEVNRNFVGLPIEGIGFSRDAPMRFGPPRFADAALQVAAKGAVIDVTLHFEPEASGVAR